MSITSAATAESRKRRSRKRRSYHHVEDCFVPCSSPCGFAGVSLLSVWIWLFHRVISHDPNMTRTPPLLQTVPDPSDTVNILPPPLYPPDMADPLLLSSSSSPPASPLMLTWQSNQHAHNQDRAVFYSTFPNRQLHAGDPSFLVALFDGHGRDGHLMADFVTESFPKALVTRLNSMPCCQSNEWISKQFNDTFYEMEERAVAMALADPSKDFAYTGGCTASVTMRIGQRLFFANAGDSRTMLASDFARTMIEDDPYSVNVRYSTRLDKADLPEERSRIQGRGGRVFTPPRDSFQPSRVVVYSQHLRDQVALAMSRSLGDREWTLVGVTPEPVVDVIQLDPAEEDLSTPYLIVASDGLWDCRARRPQFFAKRIGAILFQEGSSHGEAGQKKQLVDFVKQVTPQNPKWYRDDITVISFRL